MTRSRQTADWGSRAGLAKIVPSSVAVGSGTGSASTTGLVTFSAVSSVSLNNVFTSTYSNYRIMIDFTSSTGNNLTLRMRTSGTDGTTSEYGYIVYQITTNSTVGYTAISAGTTSMILIPAESSKYSRVALDMFNPVSDSIVTGFTWHGVRDSNSGPYGYNFICSGFDGQLAGKPASRDGFTLLASTGTISGTVSVLGYN
jgi:hypothetical protein